MDVYHMLSKPDLTEKASTRVCNALALLQVIISLLLSDVKLNEDRLFCLLIILTCMKLCLSIPPRIHVI